MTIIGESRALVYKTTENWLDFLSVTAVVATLLEAALNTGPMVREEAADTNGCRSQDLHGHEQSSSPAAGNGPSEYRALRPDDSKRNLQENWLYFISSP